jgi:hypothetical protein
MADMNQVLAKLVERTAEKRVSWRRASEPGMLRAPIGDSIVYITVSNAGQTQVIALSVMDSRGETIGSVVHFPDSPNTNQELLSLYEDAKRIAADDPRLDELLEALDAAPPVS